FNDVGVGLTAHDQQDGLPVVIETRVEDDFYRVFDPRHILHANGRAITPGHNQRLVLFGTGQLPARTDLPVIAVVFYNTVRAHGVGIGQGGTHFVQRHAGAVQGLRIQADPDRRQ